MHFGRLDDLSKVDFSLPEDHMSISKVLKGGKKTDIEIYSGCPIWSDKRWVGTVYPFDAKEKDFLRYYSHQFSAINATHYKMPTSITIAKWKAETPKHFKFCPKVPQVISHASDPTEFTGMLIEFIEILKDLGENLGVMFLQLPPYFDTRRLQVLINLLDNVPDGTPLAVEFRHESWFKGNAFAFKDICNYLYKKRLGTVITDTSGRRDAIHQRLTNTTAFIRFTANNLHPTDYDRIDVWVDRLIHWIEMGLEKLYFFPHTPDKSFNPELVYYFLYKMNEKGGFGLQLPKITSSDSKNLFDK